MLGIWNLVIGNLRERLLLREGVPTILNRFACPAGPVRAPPLTLPQGRDDRLELDAVVDALALVTT